MELPNIKEEAKEYQEKYGYYIQPYKLSILLKTAGKIFEIMTKIPQFTVTYKECEIMLDIVKKSMESMKGE